jgi:hypothetical protein
MADERQLLKLAQQKLIASEANEHLTGSRQMPTYDSFGFTKPRAEAAWARRERRERVQLYARVVLTCVSTIWITFASMHPHTTRGWVGALFPSLMIALFVYTVAFLPLGIASLAIQPVLRRIDPDSLRLDNYDDAVTTFNHWRSRTERSYWLAMSPLRFEQEVAALFQRMGYRATLTSRSGDKGMDIHLLRDQVQVAVQCKATTAPVGVGVVRELIGSMAIAGISRGIVASRGGFTSGSRTLCRSAQIELMDLDQILAASRL